LFFCTQKLLPPAVTVFFPPCSAKSKLNTTTVKVQLSEHGLCSGFILFYFFLSQKGEWSIGKKSAGGCVNHHTWRANPQYFLFASKPTTAIIWVVQSPEVFLLDKDKSSFEYR